MPDFQPVKRDFAFIVDAKSVKAGDLIKAAQGADRNLIVNVGVFESLRGSRGPRRARESVALKVTLQPREKTLTDAEIEAAAQKIVAEVGKKTGATLRG